jgi:deoxyribodipyrimidine photolyase-related protein
MDGNQPRGGQWNFDKDNRLPPPKQYDWPTYLEHPRDELDHEVSAEIGHKPSATWATTRAGALLQLEHFVQNHLAGFGPYEDAVSNSSWSMHHSLLSPYLNNGLLHAEEVVERAITEFNKSDVPLASIEAFVRQIIGWREYINGMYWYLGAEYRNMNTLNMNYPLPPAFRDSSLTKMNCISGVIKDVKERSWTHHIPRLMILSNFAQLIGVSPQEILKWMREVFIDATDWVMVPNVIGMGMHADGGVMMTKPYISGGAYISRMTQYCGSCIYNPKIRVGDDACPFTTMYWDYLDRYRDEFAGNHRMAQPYANLARLSNLDEVKLRANAVREGISRGEI